MPPAEHQAFKLWGRGGHSIVSCNVHVSESLNKCENPIDRKLGVRRESLELSFTHDYPYNDCVTEKVKVERPEGREHFQAGVVGQKSWEEHVPGE